jgi:hypothetical protein
MDLKGLNTPLQYGNLRFLSEKTALDNDWLRLRQWDIQDDISDVPSMSEGSSRTVSTGSCDHLMLHCDCNQPCGASLSRMDFERGSFYEAEYVFLSRLSTIMEEEALLAFVLQADGTSDH